MSAATVPVDAAACEVEAIATGTSEEKAAQIAQQLTDGTSRSLPARGPASAVFDELRYSDAAIFTMVAPAANNPVNTSLF